MRRSAKRTSEATPRRASAATSASARSAQRTDRREADAELTGRNLREVYDGARASPLAFLASRGDDDQKKKGAQVWLLNRAGGEAEQLTDLKGGVSDFQWSPDSRRLVLVASDPDPTEDPEKMEGWKRKTKPPIVIDRYHFKQDREGYLRSLRSHLYLFDVAAKKSDALTSGPHDDTDPAWSPDGTRIAFVSSRGPDADRDVDSNIYAIDARAGSEPRALTAFAGRDSGRPVEP